jgi:L-alanine-DL-glutamate epimerase-like enolase superfamily enzyme
MELSQRIVELKLALPWATSRTTEPGGLRISDVVHVSLRDEASGVVGFGEAAPISRYGESVATVRNFLSRLEPRSLSLDRLEESIAAIANATPGDSAAKCAAEMALLDAAGKRAGEPLWKRFDLASPGRRAISYTIGIGPVGQVQEQVRRAAAFPILKLKLGGPDDQESFRALREVAPAKWVCVDANEGWHDREHALRMIEWLARDGRVEFVEQPLPASGSPADQQWLFERSPLPLFADESGHRTRDVESLAEGFHGLNVKLMKTGGLTEAARTLRRARELGLQTMLGCMIESSLGIAAALQLAELADHLDLDSHVLLTNDPFTGLRVNHGLLRFADEATVTGLGVARGRGSSA